MRRARERRVGGLLLERPRRSTIRIDEKRRDEILDRVIERFYRKDLESRRAQVEQMVQRYAKFRMWREGKDWPWENASDAGVPDLMTHSLRVQDDLVNAVLSTRPAIVAQAQQKADSDKQDKVDKLLDFQFFEEQPGEDTLSQLAEAFVNDGCYTAFVPWVKEWRNVADAKTFDPLVEGEDPTQTFGLLIAQQFPDAEAIEPAGADGWDWRVSLDGERQKVSFWSRDDGRVEMVHEREVVVYEGPRVIPKEFEDVIHPPRVKNLQPPGPSNPGGAAHVIVRDNPTVGEIRRLIREGVYDLVGDDERDQLGLRDETARDDEKMDEFKDAATGVVDDPATVDARTQAHNRVVRLMCFDVYDLEGDGVGEDAIFWAIEEPRILLRAKRLTEVFPIDPPKRPLVSRSMLPVRGRRVGISLLEMIEPMHDLLKQIMDQSVDRGTLLNSPFGFYRASGGMKSEIIRMFPGELYPLADPQKDINFPLINAQSDAFGVNMMTILNQFEERLTMVNDLKLGSVPKGQSSALRTQGSMAMVMGATEARPERILRRFMSGIAEIFDLMFQLDMKFLPKNKVVRIAGINRPEADPFFTVDTPAAIAGKFRFTFKANVFNASKTMLQQSLQQAGMLFVNELAITLGIIDAGGVYKYMRDSAMAWGVDPDRYIREPYPNAGKQKILAQEALLMISNGHMPDGVPAEMGGPEEHLQMLMQIAQTDAIGLLTPDQLQMLKLWMAQVMDLLRIQQEQMRLAQAAGGFQQALAGAQGGGAGRPMENMPQTGNQMLSPNEQMDEGLPTSGGGANG